MKTVVSHFSPDIDSITATWLVRRFMPGWDEAGLQFVAAGSTLDGMEPDSNPEIIHVDTGFGKFDHHQSGDYTCASALVLDHLIKEKLLRKRQESALIRMIAQITGFDHFAEVYFPEPDADHYEFMLHKVIEAGLKSVLRDDSAVMENVFPHLDGLLNIFMKKVDAEEELTKGFVFTTRWGKSIAMETVNEETVKLAQKKGYKLVAKKDPQKGNIRIKTPPDKKLSLKPLYEKILKEDTKGTWYLHASGNMLLNASSRNPNFIASPLTLKRLIEIIRNI